MGNLIDCSKAVTSEGRHCQLPCLVESEQRRFGVVGIHDPSVRSPNRNDGTMCTTGNQLECKAVQMALGTRKNSTEMGAKDSLTTCQIWSALVMMRM
jgi:hypothetical protein